MTRAREKYFGSLQHWCGHIIANPTTNLATFDIKGLANIITYTSPSGKRERQEVRILQLQHYCTQVTHIFELASKSNINITQNLVHGQSIDPLLYAEEWYQHGACLALACVWLGHALHGHSDTFMFELGPYDTNFRLKIRSIMQTQKLLGDLVRKAMRDEVFRNLITGSTNNENRRLYERHRNTAVNHSLKITKNIANERGKRINNTVKKVVEIVHSPANDDVEKESVIDRCIETLGNLEHPALINIGWSGGGGVGGHAIAVEPQTMKLYDPNFGIFSWTGERRTKGVKMFGRQARMLTRQGYGLQRLLGLILYRYKEQKGTDVETTTLDVYELF